MKATEKLMSQDDIAVIDPYDQEIEADDESYTSKLDESSLVTQGDKVTFLKGEGDKVYFGSKKGRITIYSI